MATPGGPIGLSLAVALAAAPAIPGSADAATVFNCTDLGISEELRVLIAAAAPGETITFSPLSPCTIVLNPVNGPLVIDRNLTIAGNGTARTVIDGGGAVRVFTINPGVTATINGVTIRNGRDLPSDPALAGTGGGILNQGTLTVADSAITGNVARGSISGSPGGAGGGIASTGTLTLVRSTVSGNAAQAAIPILGGEAGIGGGIASTGTLTILNSTVSDNDAFATLMFGVGVGGGVASTGGTASIVSSTLAFNRAGFIPPGGSGNELAGAGGTITVRSTIVAPIPLFVPHACSGAIGSLGRNLEPGASCGFAAAGDVSGVDPRLVALRDNGGPTATVALLPGSPAIDGGDPAACPAADQRGVPRLDGGSGTVRCDIGAFEFRSPILATGTGAGGAAHVRVFSGSSGQEIFGFLAYDPGFLGGVRVAVGDVNGDGYQDVIAGAGPGGGPHVQVFDGLALLRHEVAIRASFLAFDPGFTGGIFVGAADLTADGKAEIIVGAGPGGAAHVRVFDEAGTPLAGPLGGFFAYPVGFTGGAFVAGGP
jgi:hypothetical protein